MIHVARSTPCPEKLAADGLVEIEAWRSYLKPSAKKKKGQKKPSFKAYKNKAVRQELERLFQGKCAYCESLIGHISPLDVEHWRPKGSIRTEDGTIVDGYWWLAADWTNLFPSCPHCNRPTRHEVFGGGTTAGKGMRFPTTPARTAAPAEGEELNEQPLLLNPSDPDPARAPERHLEVAEEPGKDGVIRPVDDGAGGDDELGDASIDTYSLNRADLVSRRAELVKDIRLAISTIENLILELDDVPRGGDAEARKLKMIEAQVERLDERLNVRAEYLLLARQLAESRLAEFKKRLTQ